MVLYKIELISPHEAYFFYIMIVRLVEDDVLPFRCYGTSYNWLIVYKVEIEQKLDSLLDLQLGGALSQKEYIAKKTKLLTQKIDISEKISASTQKSDNRFEPLINFIKATNQAEKIALQENPERIRDFLKKIGSNHLVRDRALSLALKKPWRVA